MESTRWNCLPLGLKFCAAVVSLPGNVRQVHRPPQACKQIVNKGTSSQAGAGRGTLRPFSKQKQKNKRCWEDQGAEHQPVCGGAGARGNGGGAAKPPEAGEHQALEGSQGDRGQVDWVSNGSSETQQPWSRMTGADGRLTEFPQHDLDMLSV